MNHHVHVSTYLHVVCACMLIRISLNMNTSLNTSFILSGEVIILDDLQRSVMKFCTNVWLISAGPRPYLGCEALQRET